jgi:hypothetical protein
MQVLIARAGLTLNPGQVADLVLAWRQIVGLLALIPRDRPLADDQAFVFRLPPPAASAAKAVAPRPPPTVRKTAAPTARKVPGGGKKAAATGKQAARAGKKAARTAKVAAPRGAKKAPARKTVRSLSSGGLKPAPGAGRGARPGGRR